LCDEISLGLAPVIIRELYERLSMIAKEGTTLVIVEQDINRALAAADRFYCFQKGRVSLEGAASGVDREKITAAYFGL
jgi:branched-chain amino acid transport system ATP-binding protein